MIVPSSYQAEPHEKLKSSPIIGDKKPPLELSEQDERMRAYHGRIDLMHAIINPEQDDFDWQVEDILEWNTKPDSTEIVLKIKWFGGDKQWITIDDAGIHDPFLIMRYVVRNKLLDTTGWEWTKH